MYRPTTCPFRLLSRAALASVVALGPVLGFVCVLAGCAAVVADLRRAEDAYEAARYESAREWLISLESELPSMSPGTRARYLYLRAMAEYRIGRRFDALHYTALARVHVEDQQGLLSADQLEMLERTYDELVPTGPTHIPSRPAE